MRKITLLSACVIVTCAMAARPAMAASVPLHEVCLLTESTLVDLDTAMIGAYYGPDTAASLTYKSTLGPTGWSGTLAGTYNGHAINVVYTGSLTPAGDPNYTLAYTSAWTIDGLVGSGSGSGTYVDPPASVDIDILNMSVTGSFTLNYGVTSVTLAGIKDFDKKTFTASGTANVGDIPLIGSVLSGSVEWNLDQVTGKYNSDLKFSAIFGLFGGSTTINQGTIGGGGGGNTSPYFNNMTSAIVPLPNSAFMALPLLAAFATARRLRRT